MESTDFFEGTEHCVIVESTALYDDILSELLRVRKLYYLKECVLYD